MQRAQGRRPGPVPKAVDVGPWAQRLPRGGLAAPAAPRRGWHSGVVPEPPDGGLGATGTGGGGAGVGGGGFTPEGSGFLEQGVHPFAALEAGSPR